MRIMTVRQPWAFALAYGHKDVENRPRNIAGDYRGDVAIHAGLTFDRGAPFPGPEHMRKMWDVGDFDYGYIIGVVNLWAVHRDRDNGNCCPHKPSGGPGGSPWSIRDQWHLCVNNARPLSEPIAYRGALGLRKLEPEFAARVLDLATHNNPKGTNA